VKLIWSTPAFHDLVAINEWLTKTAGGPISEDELTRILKKSRQLRDFPGSGPDVHGDLRSVGVRRTNYILIYRIAQEAVEIVRIRHNREDWRDHEPGGE
jgi:toxin ParE1/3/4